MSRPPPPSGPKWRRRAEARPDEILDAALAEFTERGFDAARMEDIASRAGLSKAGVYLYFPSKESLLEALISSRLGPMADMAKNLAQAGASDPRATLRLIAQNLALRMADPNIFAIPRLVIGLSGRFPAIADFYRNSIVHPALGAFEILFAAGVAKGQFRPIEPRAAARAFIGPLMFEALWTHVLRGENTLTDNPTLIESHMNVLLAGIEAAPSQTEPSA